MDNSTELRTVLQDVSNVGVVIDTSQLSSKDNIVAITLTTVAGNLFFNGQGTDDYLPMQQSVELAVDFDKQSGRLPRVKASVIGTVGIIYSILRRG